MELGYDRPLYLLAFDHRGSFEKGLFGATAPITSTVHAGIVDAKHLIFEAFALAVADGVPKKAAGVLVDEEYGAEVARAATAGGYALAMPVERSGQHEFDFEYGDDFGRHIEEFDPTFAKVLVRYNPEGDPGLNRRQTERLRRLSDWLHEHDRRFLFELLVPPTSDQLGLWRRPGPLRPRDPAAVAARDRRCHAGGRRGTGRVEDRRAGCRGRLREGRRGCPLRRSRRCRLCRSRSRR